MIRQSSCAATITNLIQNAVKNRICVVVVNNWQCNAGILNIGFRCQRRCVLLRRIQTNQQGVLCNSSCRLISVNHDRSLLLRQVVHTGFKNDIWSADNEERNTLGLRIDSTLNRKRLVGISIVERTADQTVVGCGKLNSRFS